MCRGNYGNQHNILDVPICYVVYRNDESIQEKELHHVATCTICRIGMVGDGAHLLEEDNYELNKQVEGNPWPHF